ncbi:MAG: hypothetical protein FVQ85_01385 [Planctomycetes bacterium]|nr:hypothetical protein [Planctomycetota bacterium]
MNVNKVITKHYEDNSNWALGQNEPNTNPNKANFKRGHLLIDRMNRICCLCGFSVSLDTAKMALYKNNLEFEKGRQKNLNLLRYKRLNSSALLGPLTGTLFAYSYNEKYWT